MGYLSTNPHNSVPKIEPTEEEISLRASHDQALLMINSRDGEIASLKLELSEQIEMVRIKTDEIKKFEKDSELKTAEIAKLKKTLEEKIKDINDKNEENDRLLKKNTKLRQLLEEGDHELKKLKIDNDIFIEKNKRLRRIFKIALIGYICKSLEYFQNLNEGKIGAKDQRKNQNNRENSRKLSTISAATD